MQEQDLFKGAIQSVKDGRDYQFSDIAGALPLFDWQKGFDIEQVVGKLPVKNQEQTFACGGFAWASYSYVLDQTNREEKSEKFIYSHTHASGGGSAGRVNCDFCVKNGVCSKVLCPLPNPLTEAEITRTDDITSGAYTDALTNKEKSYLSVNNDIDSVAQAIANNNGLVIGIRGENNGTWLSKFPLPPSIANSNRWAHWLYCGKAVLINGKKYIGFLNSWGDSVGEQGWQYIGEEYFGGANIFEVWTMMYNNDIASKYIFIKTLKIGSKCLDVKMLQTKLGIKADGIFGVMTQSAVEDFQHKNGLVPDGVVGKLTNNVLNK